MDFGRRPRLPEICAQSDPPPSKNADFDRFRLIVPQPWELARKVQLSLIVSRLRAFHRAINEPCLLLLSSPKGGSKRKFFTFGVACHFFVAGDRRHFKLYMWVEHSKSQPTDDKTSLKWTWSRHLTHFKLLVFLKMICNDFLPTSLKVVSSCLLQYKPVCETNFDKLCRINAKNYKFIGLFGIAILRHVWRNTWICLSLIVLFALLCVIAKVNESSDAHFLRFF